jgi:hypothetical protein
MPTNPVPLPQHSKRSSPPVVDLARQNGRMHRDRWRHRSGREHGGAGREANLIFVLPPNVYVGPPGRGDFLVSNFGLSIPEAFLLLADEVIE